VLHAPLRSAHAHRRGGGRRGCYQMVCFLRAKQPDVPCAEKGFKKEVLLERVRAVIIATLAPGAPLPPAV
jgi:hypothetical protein